MWFMSGQENSKIKCPLVQEGGTRRPAFNKGWASTYLRTDSLPATAKFILGHFEWKACKGVSVHTSMARHLPKPDFQITSSGEEERPKDPRATHV